VCPLPIVIELVGQFQLDITMEAMICSCLYITYHW